MLGELVLKPHSGRMALNFCLLVGGGVFCFSMTGFLRIALAVLGLPLQTRLALNSEISPASSSQVQGLELGVPYHTQHRVALFDMTEGLMSCEFSIILFTQ